MPINRVMYDAKYPPFILRCLLSLALCAASAGALPADDFPNTQDTKDLTNLSLDELMNVKVTSASKKEQSLSNAAAAIFVVTSEDIRRGGFTTIPEALRIVPGLFVARVNADWWTVSARGFGDYLNDKMLVLIDGRSVYDLQFGGVEWDQIELPMEDIDRIEVIRGPGGTLWGANAVNGIINIITKKARQTQGFSVSTNLSPEEGAISSVRCGGTLGSSAAYRIFGKSEYWDPGLTPSRKNAYDSWNISQGGLRLDWDASQKDAVTFEGRGYDGHIANETPVLSGPGIPESLLFEKYDTKGRDFLVDWRHTFSKQSYADLLGYCDWTDRTGVYFEKRNTCDVEFQNNHSFTDRHSIVWGGSVSTSGSDKPGFFAVSFAPPRQRYNVVSGFAQYEVVVVPDRFTLTGGAKIEYNSFTAGDVQPQIRGVWTPTKNHAVWAAVSRALHVPAQYDEDAIQNLTELPGMVPTYLAVVGNPKLKTEKLRAYELGYRFQHGSLFALDADIFYNHYGDLIDLNLAQTGPPIIHTNPSFAEVPVQFQNISRGQTHGAEAYARIKPAKQWEIGVGMTELRGNGVNFGESLNQPMGNSPRHQFNVQSRLDLTRHLALDSALYYYGAIPLFLGAQNLHAHNRVDVGLTLHGISGTTFSVWGRDLGTSSHPEDLVALFTTTGSYVQRSVGFTARWESSPQ